MSDALLPQIEPYKRQDGSYDVRRMEKDFGVESTLDRTFDLLFNSKGGVLEDDDLRIKLAVEINGRLHDEKKAAERSEIQSALARFQSGDATIKDARLLERSNLVVAEYGDADSERPTGFRLKDQRDVDGNIYTDQAGIEDNAGNL